jgi:hypothetical protein
MDEQKKSRTGLPVRPYSNRVGKWKDGGSRKATSDIDAATPVNSKKKKASKPSKSNKWYLGRDGLVHIVTIGRFNAITEIMAFDESVATPEQQDYLAAATEAPELKGK